MDGRFQLCEVAEVVVLQSFKILLIEKDLDALLNISHLGNESLPDLVDGFADELLVLHALAGLHDSHDRRL